MAHALGNVRVVGFDLLRQHGRGCALRAPAPADVTAAWKQVYARNAALERMTGVHIALSPIEKARRVAQACAGCEDCDFAHCYAMHAEQLVINPDGTLYAEPSMEGQPDFAVGDVFTGVDHARLLAIGERMSRAMAFCRECPDFIRCGGGCYARWFGSSGPVDAREECALRKSGWEALQHTP